MPNFNGRKVQRISSVAARPSVASKALKVAPEGRERDRSSRELRQSSTPFLRQRKICWTRRCRQDS